MSLCGGGPLTDVLPATAADGSACFAPCPSGRVSGTAMAQRLPR
jgi:hypothetical protein